MIDYYQKYLKESDKNAFNSDLKKSLKDDSDNFIDLLENIDNQHKSIDVLKSKASNIKRKTLVELENYLKEFEGNFTKNGGQIIWAPNKEDAIDAVNRVLKNHDVRNIVKSKFLIADELDLDNNISKSDFNLVDIDFDDFVSNLDADNILNFDKENNSKQLVNILKSKYKIDEIAKSDDIIKLISNKIKNNLMTADAGITGADFMISDIGAFSVSDNNANTILAATSPRIHIAIIGIEQIIPSLKDVETFWGLLAAYKDGSKFLSNNHIITGPSNKSNGAEKHIVIILDNGRSNVLKTEHQFEAMNCIKCKACSYICPVFTNIGESAYNSTYTGPIGSVLMPLMEGFEKYNHLSYACSDCGKCDDICPVGIPIYQLILRNRKQAIDNGFEISNLKRSIKFYKLALNNKTLVEKIPVFIKQSICSYAVNPSFSKGKQLPKLAKKSFSQIWKEEER